MSGAVAALVIGGAAAPAAYAAPADKGQASNGKKVGHSKSSAPKKAGHAKKVERSRASSSNGSNGSNKDGSGHDDAWQAQSDPDGMTNGGVDQPGGNGGYDPKGWDGNNGSGNDPDCEDDNRGQGVPGHCKDRPAERSRAEHRKPARTTTAQPSRASVVVRSSRVLGSETVLTATRTGGSTVMTGTGAEVLGVAQLGGLSQAAAAAPAEVNAARTVEDALPDTGAEAALAGLLLGGLAAAGTGTVLLRRNRATQG